MLSALREIGRNTGPRLLPLLLAVAALDLVVVRAGAVLQRIGATGLWADLANFQSASAPFLRNLFLLTAGLVAVFLLPRLVLGGRGRGDRLLLGGYALATLGLLGLAAVRAAAAAPLALDAQNAVYVAGGLTAALLALLPASGRAFLPRLQAAFFLAAALAPMIWRFAYARGLGGAETREGLRDAADAFAPLAMLGCLVPVLAARARGAAIAAALLILAPIALASALRPDDARRVLVAATDLWLTSWPAAPAAVLGAGLAAVVALLLASLRRADLRVIASACGLIAAAGFLPTENATMLCAWCGVLVFVGWAKGARRVGELFA